MTTSTHPEKITIRTYNVGFGDCFLLKFHYQQFERNILLDFGTTSRPHGSSRDLKKKIAIDIKEKCNQKLHAVIATHRHRDHISGFRTSKNGLGSGDIIASCKPDIVIQPWTEHPQAKSDATEPPSVLMQGGTALRQPYSIKISSMQSFMKYAVSVARKVEKQNRSSMLGSSQSNIDKEWEEIEAVGTTNLKNLNAIKNLSTMSHKNKYFYVHFGSKSGLEEVLPGVTTHVLGPPTLKQSEGETLSQRSADPTEFWKLQARAEKVVRDKKYKLFPGADIISGEDPVDIRWFKDQFHFSYKQQLLQFVRDVDNAINNTSVILLMECGKEKLLFSGDAQIENWQYALNKSSVQDLLKDVTVYKVGHHGSTNATPKTLWGLFENKKSIAGTKEKLMSINSTLSGHHSGVPRESLINSLENESTYFSTETLEKEKIYNEITINI
jgi:beta-lactamase superfamily II metal-dependent hydrolase